MRFLGRRSTSCLFAKTAYLRSHCCENLTSNFVWVTVFSFGVFFFPLTLRIFLRFRLRSDFSYGGVGECFTTKYILNKNVCSIILLLTARASNRDIEDLVILVLLVDEEFAAALQVTILSCGDIDSGDVDHYTLIVDERELERILCRVNLILGCADATVHCV